MLWFNKKKEQVRLFYHTDLHSHIIPGIDDGSPDVDTSIELLRHMQAWGITHAIATPHVTEGNFENSPSTIEPPYKILCETAVREGLDIKISYSAEYRIDENFRRIFTADDGRLRFVSQDYLLVENSFLQPPIDLDNLLFEIQLRGYKPILAHPERYRYYFRSRDVYSHLHNVGSLFQVNLLSFAGYYGKEQKEIAWELARKGYVDFVGSDLHSIDQALYIDSWLSTKEYRKFEKKLSHIANDTLV